MGALRRLGNIAWFVSCLLAAPVQAAITPFAGESAYRFTWQGIPFGEMTLKAEQTEAGFSIETHVRSTGIAKMLAEHESETSVEGKGAPSVEAARIYQSRWHTRGKHKEVRLEYAPGGALKAQDVEPPENPATRPPPTPAQLSGVPDLLTYLPVLRETVEDLRAQGGGAATLPVFDGRRLAKTDITLYGPGSRKDCGANTLKVGVRRTPLAGFTEKERKKMKGEPEATLCFSDDAQLMPVQLYVDLWFGRVIAKRITPGERQDE